MQLKVIKTAVEHEAAVNALLALMDADPRGGTKEADQLEVLALLIEKYEEEHFPIDLPDPVEAIRFRMEQQNLTQKDLAPYIGSAARVSEVLNHKRPLSLRMIRNLHKSLDIPAKVLIREAMLLDDKKHGDVEWAKFPLKELNERNWLNSSSNKLTELKEYAEELMKGFLHTLALPSDQLDAPTLLRSTLHQRGGKKMNKEALLTWQLLVQKQVMDNPLEATYSGIDEGFLKQVVQVSWSEQGPLLARELLNQRGIHLVIEPHFKQTYLDGAAFWGIDGKPIVALTARYDRLDNFWFSLMHELSHVHLHLDDTHTGFFDDLKSQGDHLNSIETEADEFARHMLIDEELWRSSEFGVQTQKADIEQLAQQLNISPAIIAGRIQYESRNFQCHRTLLGHKQVRYHYINATLPPQTH